MKWACVYISYAFYSHVYVGFFFVVHHKIFSIQLLSMTSRFLFCYAPLDLSGSMELDTKPSYWLHYTCTIFCTVFVLSRLHVLQIEISTGKFPYSQWETPFEQLRQVVQDPPPKLPDDGFSPLFVEFVNNWWVMCWTDLLTYQNDSELLEDRMINVDQLNANHL